MKYKKSFFLGHLEDISWRAFDEYPEVLRSLIRGKSGIYALYHNTTLYYVGLASNLMSRLKAHLRDRHIGKWDRFSVYLTIDSGNLKELESLVLRIMRRSGNAVSGKLSGSKNLHSELNNRIKEIEKNKRATILGGPVARRLTRHKAKTYKGAMALSGVSDKEIRITGTHKGKKHIAVLKKNGMIRFKGEQYNSPSAAAVAIVGTAVNGWHFWSYRNKKGKWAKLSELKQ